MFEVPIGDMFSELNKLSPNATAALIASTITEDMKYFSDWLAGVENKDEVAQWIAYVFDVSCDTDNVATELPALISRIYISMQQFITAKLVGHPIYVIGYCSDNLIVASREFFSKEEVSKLIGGFV